MTQAAGPKKLTFYCPLTGQLDDDECDAEYISVGDGFLSAYQDQIEQAIADTSSPRRWEIWRSIWATTLV